MKRAAMNRMRMSRYRTDTSMVRPSTDRFPNQPVTLRDQAQDVCCPPMPALEITYA